MNKNKLKTYAPQARKDFIAAVTARAQLLGLSEHGGKLSIAPAEKSGDLVMIAGQAWPAKVHGQREKLIERMQRDGYGQTLEAVAYTWFNRFAALRFMEIHDYLGHGHRVLSSRAGGLPEILQHAVEVAQSGELPGLKADKVTELKLAGNQDGELYRLLLVAQCNALSSAMPFLFERIDDETELLLPDNLLRTDSVIAKLVAEIAEEDWSEVEIIGWLYQFYISEKKDQVIGKVVKSEDIPAATQLFTPNWIVKYMVQNSLGAQWLATYPQSPLKAQMEYYIEPAEQTDEVNAQLAAITPSQLNPEELTLIDPASGSGHILVEAYELFKAIYLERGYRQRDVAQLILEKNLFGLDIDERAAQLTGFALIMKGRADDRRLFERGVKLNVMALVDSAGFDAEGLASFLRHSRESGNPDYGLKPGDLTELKRLFEHATTFGSLIQVPEGMAEKLPALKQLSEATSQDLFVSEALKRLRPLVQQAEFLAAQYDAVVANPPYMGGKGMNAQMKKFANDHFPDARTDLFACFIEQGSALAKEAGHTAMVTMQSWMFLSSLRKLRARILGENTITSMAHLGTRAFDSIGGEIVSTTAFALRRYSQPEAVGVFVGLTDAGSETHKATRLRQAAMANSSSIDRHYTSASELAKIPGCPIAYWVSHRMLRLFETAESVGDIVKPRQGMSTNDNARFLRRWFEASFGDVGLGLGSAEQASASGCKWFPYNKGGPLRKWFGNYEYVVNWLNDGEEIKEWLVNNPKDPNTSHWSRRIINTDFYFKEGITWADITTRAFAARFADQGSLFDVKGSSAFPEADKSPWVLGLMNSTLMDVFMGILNPTVTFQVGDISRVPFVKPTDGSAKDTQRISTLVSLSRADWNAYERSWNFQSLPLLPTSTETTPTLESSYAAWTRKNRDTIAEMKRLEEENNRLFIDAYGLADELTPDVPLSQVTLTVNPAYRYGGKLTEEESWTRFRQDSMVELVSYAIGCMMGRYRLDRPGLVYAHAGNIGFKAIYEGVGADLSAPGRMNSPLHNPFPADADGIVPITDELWFEDDAANRVREFLLAVWGDGNPSPQPSPTRSEGVEENMAWLAESLGKKASETPDETIRRYFADKFFKDHLQTYKKRPIYWLFSSGKQGAFQALVYLHRYHEGTLARMRAEYVVPLTGKIQSRIDMLEKDANSATSTAARNKLNKQIEALKKKHVELLAYDEKLRHYADMRIQLDLDDGVKVNYGKFGDLLAEVKSITGGSSDD